MADNKAGNRTGPLPQPPADEFESLDMKALPPLPQAHQQALAGLSSDFVTQVNRALDRIEEIGHQSEGPGGSGRRKPPRK